jgi:hypothetical protein
MRVIALSVFAILGLASVMPAQSPMPVIIPAVTPAVASSRASAVSENSASLQAALKVLREMKAANEETLGKQAATLGQLDELEKAADQIRVYSKRG